MHIVTVAVAQTFGTDDIQRNYTRAEEMIAEAADKGARLVVFPEFMNYIGSPNADSFENIPDGEACRRMSAAAKKHHMWVHLGSIYEKTEEKPYNTSVLFSPEGEINAVYRKLHLADIQLHPKRPPYLESDYVSRGDRIVVADTDFAKIGMAICYDLRFPEMYRLMSDKGASIICNPACFSTITGEGHWEVLLRSIAILNHCYVLASNHCGNKPNGHRLWGHSMIIDPWGTVIAQAGQDKEALLVADIDLDYCETLRKQLGCMTNRRLDMYAIKECQNDKK